MLLKLVADREIAELRRVHLPLHGVTPRPVAARGGADRERHADAVAGIETRTAHLGEVPAGAQITRAPLRIGFESAAGEHDRFRAQFKYLAVLPHEHALDTSAIVHNGTEARSAADRFQRKSAPDPEPAVDLECLATIDRNKTHALLAHPIEGREAFRDQKLDEIGIGAMLRQTGHVVVELLRRIGTEIRALHLGRSEIGDKGLDILDAIIDHADRAGGEAAVATRLLLRR